MKVCDIIHSRMENIKCKSNTIAEGQQTAPKFHGGGGMEKDKIECCECTVSVAGQIPQPLVIGEM